MSVLNREPRRRRALRVAGAVVALSLLSACAALKPATPEETVARRAGERWQAILKGDFQTAYGYLSPAGRALMPLERWRGTIGGATAWQKAEVASVRCETSEKCIAVIKVVHQPLLFRDKLGSIESSFDETWLIDGGQWWLLHRP